MIRSLRCFCIALVVAGCQSERKESPASNLDSALKLAGQEDIVMNGGRVDVMLYWAGDTCIWLRHTSIETDITVTPPPGTAAASLSPGKSLAGIYILSKDRCIGAIPVDVWKGPYVPLICPMGGDEMLIISYGYGDPEAISQNRFEYAVRVHRVAGGECKEVLRKRFQVIEWREINQNEGLIRAFLYVPFASPLAGRSFVALAELAWDVPITGPTEDIRMSVTETIPLDLGAEVSTQPEQR